MARPEHRRTPRLPQRLPEVVRAKRSVVADSFIVLRSLVRQLSERRTLARLVTTGVVTIVGLVMLWRLLGHRGTGPVLGNRLRPSRPSDADRSGSLPRPRLSC